MIAFIQKHPKLLFWSISFLTLVTGFLLASVNWTMLKLILLKGKDPNPPPAPPPEPPPAPKLEEPKRKVFQMPYVPSWVAASFKNRHKHPLYGGITVSAPSYILSSDVPQPLPSVEVTVPDESESVVEQEELSPTIVVEEQVLSTDQPGSETTYAN